MRQVDDQKISKWLGANSRSTKTLDSGRIVRTVEIDDFMLALLDGKFNTESDEGDNQ